MFEVEYTRFKFCRIKYVYFAERLPSLKGYHIVFFHNCYNDLPVPKPFKAERCQTILLDLTQDVDKLFGQIKRQRRQFIRRGEKAGIQVTARKPSDDLLKEFQELYNNTIGLRTGAPMINIGSLKVLAPYMTIFKATFEGQTLEMMSYLHDGKTVLLHYLARQEDNLAPDLLQGCGSYLQWESIRYFKKMGYQVLDLGGWDSDRQSHYYNINRYKQSFGGEVTPIYWYSAVSPLISTALKGRDLAFKGVSRLKSFLCR